MMYGVVCLALVGLISVYPHSSCAASMGYPEELSEESQTYFLPQLRERRSPQFNLSGGGSHKEGTVRLDGQRNVFNNGKTGVDVNGFAQRSWQQGYPAQNSFGAGAAVTHNIYKGRNGEVDLYGGYQRQWNTPDRHNAMGGVRWRF